MRSLRSDLARVGLLAAGLVLCTAPHARAQDLRDVVSKEVAVGRDEAILRLGVADGITLEIGLTAGNVVVDDEVVASYEPGGVLDAAWRTLLGTAVALEDGPLAQALVAWSPPEGLEGGARQGAERIDRAIEGALLLEVPPPAAAPPAPEASGGLGALLGRTQRLAGLARALEGLELDGLHLTVGENLAVGRDTELNATVVVVDGDLELEGVIRGDVVVLGGDVVLEDASRITGELRYADGRVLERGGAVEGGIREIEADATLTESEIRARIREEVRTATREGIREATRSSRTSRSWGPLARVGRGIGGALGNLFTVLVLGLAGGVVLYFAGPRLDAVAETVRRSPGRSAMVGAAGAFLVLPAWVLGVIALVISIIGIPALILWVPLFPLAVVAAAAIGYLAVARNLGAWLARQRYPFMDWVRVTNPYSLIFGGVLVLMAAFIAANVLSIVPFLGVLRGLLVTAGVVATSFAVLAGFGAVILTRGGRPIDYWGDDFFSTGSGGGWDGPVDDPDPAPAPEPAPTGSAGAREPGAGDWEDPAPTPPPAPDPTTAEAPDPVGETEGQDPIEPDPEGKPGG
jgi:hypothetical protein